MHDAIMLVFRKAFFEMLIAGTPLILSGLQIILHHHLGTYECLICLTPHYSISICYHRYAYGLHRRIMLLRNT